VVYCRVWVHGKGLEDGMADEGDHDAGRRERGADPALMLSEQDRARIDEFRSKHATELLVILFTDLVGSAALKSELGDAAYKDLDDEHRRLLLLALGEFTKAQAIRVEGDAYIFVFLKPSDAVKFALRAQALHRESRAGDWPRLPEFRVGIHLGTVVVEDGLKGPSAPGAIGDIKGLQADMTARVMSLAEGGQVLCSRAVFDDARQALKGADLAGIGTLGWVSHGLYFLKGREDPLEVCEVGEEGVATFAKPAGNEKARPADLSDEELGWRPAVGVVVPGSDWELEDKLGEGEFGEVWLGRNRTSGERQVYKFCFKRDRVAWLKREARLLIELRKRLPGHPNIVAFRDVMTEHDKPPYYITMEYVDGPALEAWIETQPTTKERLELIAQVAAGLDAVHAEGIYHRDIKPSNILLERKPDGSLQAKLSDFGLGTTDDPELLRSVYASRVEGMAGTWDYIAPEVREGTPASAQSDIYALGLTLYRLVVGDLDRPLASGWERQVESEVLREDIAKCMDAEPAERWPRAKELATALRTHDQRVRQRLLEQERELHHKRVVRFRIIAGVSAAFAAVMLVLGSYAWHLRGEAVRQRTMAEEQRDRAVKQKELALSAVRKLTYDVPDRLKDVPGTLAALREIMESNVAILDEILAFEPDTPEAHHEKCANLLGIGHRWIQLGDSPKALETYEAAAEIAQQLVEADPGNVEAKRDLGNSQQGLGDAYLRLGLNTKAKAAYEACLEIRRELAGRDDADAEARQELAMSYGNFGDMYLSWARPYEALEAYQAGHDILEALAEEHPDDAEVEQALGAMRNALGDVYVAVGRKQEALDQYKTGLDLLVASAPEGKERQRALAFGYSRLGNVYFALGMLDEALESHQAGLQAAAEFVAASPESVVAKRVLAAAHNSVGDLYAAHGMNDEARAEYVTMLELVEELARADPASTEAQRDVAVAHNRLGDLASNLYNTDEALAEYEATHEITKGLASNSESLLAQRDLAVSYDRLGTIYHRLGRTDEAIEMQQGALAISKRLVEQDPDVPQWQRDLASNHGSLGDVYFTLGDAEETLAAYERMEAVVKTLADANPDDVPLQLGLSVHNRLGDVYLCVGRTTEAVGAFETMYRMAKAELERTPRDFEAHQGVVISTSRLSDACIALGSREQALEYYVLYTEATTGRAPTDQEANQFPYWATMRLGDWYLQFHRGEAALGAYRGMLAEGEALAADAEALFSTMWLAGTHERLAKAYDALGRVDEAEAARTKAQALKESADATRREPDDSDAGE